MDINEHTIKGRLGADPFVLQNDRGKIAKLRVATNYRYNDHKGEWQTKTVWHCVIVRDALVDEIAHLKKGHGVFVQGYAEEYQWDAGAGEIKTRHQVVAKRIFPVAESRQADKASQEQANDRPPAQRQQSNAPPQRGAKQSIRESRPGPTSDQRSTNQPIRRSGEGQGVREEAQQHDRRPRNGQPASERQSIPEREAPSQRMDQAPPALPVDDDPFADLDQYISGGGSYAGSH